MKNDARINIRLPQPTKDKLLADAKQLGMTLSEYLLYKAQR